MLLGQNEKKTGGKSRRSNLANVFESLIGAVYLDAGLGKARDFLLEQISSEIEKVSRAGFIRDYKSALQELVQQNKWGLPQYHVIREIGPKHKKVFLVEVKVRGRGHGTGRGLSKKDAEQRAAFEALRKLKGHAGNLRANAAKESNSPNREGARSHNVENRKTELPKHDSSRASGIGGILSRVRRRFAR
jgi:ribonuclease-3